MNTLRNAIAMLLLLCEHGVRHLQDWVQSFSVIEAAGMNHTSICNSNTHTVIAAAGTPVLMWQTISMFEIFHAAFELSPGASVVTVCVTFAERMMMLTACLLPFPQLRTNVHVCVPFIAWSLTNVVRFACVSSHPNSHTVLFFIYTALNSIFPCLFTPCFYPLIQLFCVGNPAPSIRLGLQQPFDRKFSFRCGDEASLPERFFFISSMSLLSRFVDLVFYCVNMRVQMQVFASFCRFARRGCLGEMLFSAYCSPAAHSHVNRQKPIF